MVVEEEGSMVARWRRAAIPGRNSPPTRAQATGRARRTLGHCRLPGHSSRPDGESSVRPIPEHLGSCSKIGGPLSCGNLKRLIHKELERRTSLPLPILAHEPTSFSYTLWSIPGWSTLG